MATKRKKYDLIVVGGGLSATFLCLTILKKNTHFKILLIEKNDHFPQKVGESFIDITALFVESLDIEHLLKDQTVKTGVRYLFNETNSLNIADIKEFASPTQPGRIKGYHINRRLFDEQMIEEVQSRGVNVLRPATIISSTHLEFDNRFKIEVDGTLFDVESKWVVDSTGRNRSIAKKINWKISNNVLNTGSIMAHLTHDSISTSWDTPSSQIWNNQAIGSRDFATTHLMRKHAWWWVIRLNETTTSLGIVFDKSYHKVDDPAAFFTSMLKKDRQLELLSKDSKLGPIKHIDNLSYFSEKLYTKGIVLLGESGAFLDPLFSPGLELISQQIQWLTPLLIEEKKSNNFNSKAWSRYNSCFQKAYESRLELYKTSYKIMHSFDIFSPWLMMGNYFYYARVVFPAVKFRKRLKYPLRFTTLEHFIFRVLGKRFSAINDKRFKLGITPHSSSINIRFSGVKVPKGKLFYFIPLLLLAKAFIAYLKIEFDQMRLAIFKKNIKNPTKIQFRFSSK